MHRTNLSGGRGPNSPPTASRRRRWVALGALLAVAIATPPGPAGAQRGRRARIAVVVDGPGAGYRELAGRIQEEIEALLGDGWDLTFVPPAPAFQDFTPAAVGRAVDAALDDPEVDVVVPVGILGARHVAEGPPPSKPVILPAVAPGELAGLPVEGGRSTRPNVTFVRNVVDVEADLTRFRELVPYTHLAVLFDAHLVDALPGLPRFLEARAGGARITVVPVVNAQQALADLPADADAVYVGGTPGTSEEDLAAILAGLEANRVPSFAASGPELVQLGALATIRPEADWVRRARRVALHVERLLEGERAEELPVDFEPGQALVINLATARAVGVYPSFALMTEAELVNPTRQAAPRTLGFREALRLAVERNLDLRSAEQSVEAGRQDVAAARAPLLPTVRVGANGRIIDDDRAAGFQPGAAERVVSWNADLEQVLFSEAAWTGFRASERAQEAVEEGFQAARLDVLQQAADAYLQVLQAKTAERIQRENLERARANLDLAEVRRRVGVAGPNEVYRWQIEIAASRADVIGASARRNQAEIELNRVLNRPLEEPFVLEEAEIDGSALLVGDARLATFFENPFRFRMLRDFLADESLGNAPELRRLDASVAATRRTVEGQRRVLFLPTVAAAASLDHFFLSGGAGTETGGGQFPPPESDFDRAVAGALTSIPSPDDWNWTVGVSVSLPLFEGGGRYADLRRSRAELLRLEADRAAAAQRVEQRVRSALHAAGASRAAVALTEEAAEAARNNLRVVTDAYQRGAENVITLIDAQNQALVQELAAANAVYTFLLDFVEVERALGRFTFDMDEGDRDAFFSRLRDFSAERGGQAGGADAGDAR